MNVYYSVLWNLSTALFILHSQLHVYLEVHSVLVCVFRMCDLCVALILSRSGIAIS